MADESKMRRYKCADAVCRRHPENTEESVIGAYPAMKRHSPSLTVSCCLLPPLLCNCLQGTLIASNLRIFGVRKQFPSLSSGSAVGGTWDLSPNRGKVIRRLRMSIRACLCPAFFLLPCDRRTRALHQAFAFPKQPVPLTRR